MKKKSEALKSDIKSAGLDWNIQLPSAVGFRSSVNTITAGLSCTLSSTRRASPQQGGFLGGEICLSFPTKPATISNVWCLEICAGTLFLMLLKFGAVLSIICGFLIAIYTWIHLPQLIVVVQSFLRMLKLCKLAVHKLYLSTGGRTRCQGVSDNGLNLHQNIPLMVWSS